jgi:hypothetical protein
VTEVQPHGADATAPLAAGGSLPLPYAYRIDRPAPHRPEGEFMMSYGTWDTAPGPITTVQHAAEYAIAQTRIAHAYYGPMTVRLWAHRGADEHYRNEPPATAYRLDVGDQTDRISPAVKTAVEQIHNATYSLCRPCHEKRGTPGATGAVDPGGSSG